MLEHHPHFLPVDIDVCFFIRNVRPLKEDMSACRHLQKVQTAQEGGFAGAGGPDDNNNLALFDFRIDTVQCLNRTALIIFL